MMQSIYRIHWPAERWLQLKGDILLVWAIFNPNGPTVHSLGSVEHEWTREVFLRWQNPFREAAFGLGRCDIDEDSGVGIPISQIVRNAFRPRAGPLPDEYSPFTCIPSLLGLPEKDGLRAVATGWLRYGLSHQAFDWGREGYYLDKYGRRLFDRAGDEIRGSVEEIRKNPAPDGSTQQMIDWSFARWGGIETFRNWQPASYESKSFSDAAFDQWFSNVSGEEFTDAAVSQLAQAWVGSIDFITRHGGNSVQTVVSFDDLAAFMAHFNFALWPEGWTTDSVMRRLGLEDAANEEGD